MRETTAAPQKRQLLLAGVAMLALFALLGLLRLTSPPVPTPPAETPSLTEATATLEAPAAQEAPVRVSLLGLWSRLLVVLLCAYGLLLGLRWWKGGALRRAAGSDAGPAGGLLHLRDTLLLGGGREVLLLEVAGRLLVLGCAQGQLCLLSRLDLIAEPEPPSPAPRHEALPVVTVREPESVTRKTLAVPEWEWEQKRARLIDALQHQVEE